MTIENLKKDVLGALSRVSASQGGDVVSKGQVQKLDVQEDGTVRFSFFMSPEDPGALVKELRSAAEGVEGVSSVKVNVQLPQTPPSGPQAAGPQAPGPHPAGPPGQVSPQGGPEGGPAPGSVPTPTPRPTLLADVKRIVAVSSGKGGVGKSMVAANLATALAQEGKKVGLLDADIYGPNIPLLFGETRRPGVMGEEGQERIMPLETHGVRLMSLGFMLDKEQPAIMRGPLISGILRQFLEQVVWGSLDYMVVDMPPGTGDAQISLVQTIDIDGAIMVTTPQPVSTGDVRRGVKMFEKVNTQVLGIVENMSGEVFGSGGGESLAEELRVPFLGRIPLDAAVRISGDEGVPTVARAPKSDAADALKTMAREIREILDELPPR
jgi:ATP-binding protein involved in chromosome partitioning